MLESPAFLPLLTVIGIAIATIMLSAIWAAYGTGSLFLRCVISLTLTFMVGLAIVCGLPKDTHAAGLALLAALPAYWCASQAVHWLFRFTLGWQFVLGDNKPLPATFNVRELFFVTFLVAVSFVGVRIATNLFLDANPQLVSVIHEAQNTGLPPNAVQSPEVREIRKSVEQLVSLQLTMYAGFAAVISLLMTLPLLLVSAPKSLTAGITWISVATIGYIAIWLGLHFAFGLGFFGITNSLFILLAVTNVAFMVPLIHSRALGVSLKLKRQSVEA